MKLIELSDMPRIKVNLVKSCLKPNFLYKFLLKFVHLSFLALLITILFQRMSILCKIKPKVLEVDSSCGSRDS
jgi:hypothetical protein